MKLLLLEDDKSLHAILKEYLEYLGHEVEAFYDGGLAQEALAYELFELCVLDVNVPTVDGLELLAYLREVNEKAKVIIITAQLDMETLKKAYASRCNDYMRKPFELEELRLRIEALFPEASLIQLSDSTLFDMDSKTLLCESVEVTLTKKEQNFINLLVKNLGKIVSYETIENYVWEGEVKENYYLRQFVLRFKKKVGDINLVSVSGQGYSLHVA